MVRTFLETISLFNRYKTLLKSNKVKLLLKNLKIKNFRDNLSSALSETLPILLKDGNYINIDTKKLDYLRNLKDQSRKYISLLEKNIWN